MAAVSSLIIAASALSAGASVASGNAMRRAANDAVREGNRAATAAIAGGQATAAKYQVDLAQVLGRQVAAQGASGVDLTQGSAAAVRAETAKFGAADLQVIRENALREAYGLRRQGQQTAQALRANATGAYGQAFGTVLSAGARGWELYSQGRTIVTNNTIRGAMSSTKWGG